MAIPTQDYFAELSSQIQNVVESISLKRLEMNPERALWEIHAFLKSHHIRFKEIHTPAERLYSYYVIRNNEVIIGFDNYPDRHVLRQKYGDDFHKHLFEAVPHKHGFRKTAFELTEEMSVSGFLTYLTETL